MSSPFRLGVALIVALTAMPYNAWAHDGLRLHATSVVTAGSAVAVETEIGLAVADGSNWSIFCTDALGSSADAVRRTSFLADGTIAIVRDYSVGIANRACDAGASRLLMGGRILASTVVGATLQLIVGDDTMGTALVSVDAAAVRTRNVLPTPLLAPSIFARGDSVCAIGTANEKTRLECLAGGRFVDRELGVDGPVTPLIAGAERVFLARRTAPLEPDVLVAVDNIEDGEVSELVLPGMQKIRGAALVGDRLYVAARAIAGSDAARGTLHGLDPRSLAAVTEAVVGPSFECLQNIGGALFACVDRGVEPDATTVVVSDDAVSFRRYFSFDDVRRLDTCEGSDCAKTRLALCRSSGRFCTSSEPAPDAAADHNAPGACTYGAATGSVPVSLLALVLLQRRRRCMS